MPPSPSDVDPLHLTEARLSTPVRLTLGERRALEDHFEAKITTEPDESYRVQPGSVVGSVPYRRPNRRCGAQAADRPRPVHDCLHR